MEIAELYLSDVRERMRGVKALGEGALAQLREDEVGAMRSRWGDLRSGFTSGAEGETATRDRDAEFEERELSLTDVREEWEDGWAVFLDALDHLTPADLSRTLTIRGEPHTVLEAVQRQVAHYSGHVYQLVFLVKTLRGEEWETLSIARGGSAAFSTRLRGRHGLS